MHAGMGGEARYNQSENDKAMFHLNAPRMRKVPKLPIILSSVNLS
jgi:hypothetical protein